MPGLRTFLLLLAAQIGALNALAVPVAPSAPVPQVTRCLQSAERGADPLLRDRIRLQCLRTFGPRLDRRSCLRFTRGFEYSMNSEAMKSFCIFELKNDPRPAECIIAAASMDYGSSRDDLIWGCLKRTSLTIRPAECRRLTQLMVFPFQKARATSYCENEIRTAR